MGELAGNLGLQKARALRPGDLIGVVAPAGPVPEEALVNGVNRLQALGFRVQVGASVLNRRGYLAGTDEERARDFNAMWADPAVAGILCARGGYGAMRILHQIDWTMVRARPKFFCGFSDITALHLAMEQRAGLVTFHGPMVAAFGEAVAYNESGLWRAMTATEPLSLVPWPEPGEGAPVPLTIRSGVAEGRLAGGNLTLLCALMGTPWEPDLKGRLLMIEEVDEAPYRVDRMLQQLLLAGKLQGAAGILIGDSPSCMKGPEGRASLTLPEVLDDLLRPLGVPVLYGFPCGHTAFRATLPLGIRARLDAAKGSLTLLESALVPER